MESVQNREGGGDRGGGDVVTSVFREAEKYKAVRGIASNSM